MSPNQQDTPKKWVVGVYTPTGGLTTYEEVKDLVFRTDGMTRFIDKNNLEVRTNLPVFANEYVG